MHYFDWSHLCSLCACAALVVTLYFALKEKSEFAKKVALGVLIGLNLAQHFLKCYVWPHMWGMGFGLENTAYNVCAFLILLAPFAVFGKSPLLKQYFAYVGTCAGAAALLGPTWFVGKTLLDWEFARFWFCHALLLASALLSALWGTVPFRRDDGWKFGLLFLSMLALVLANDAVYLSLFGGHADDLYTQLLAHNPLWVMGPPESAAFLLPLISALSPAFFLGGGSGPYTPLLWYAFPVWLGVTILAYAFGSFSEPLYRRYERKHPFRARACAAASL